MPRRKSDRLASAIQFAVSADVLRPLRSNNTVSCTSSSSSPRFRKVWRMCCMASDAVGSRGESASDHLLDAEVSPGGDLAKGTRLQSADKSRFDLHMSKADSAQHSIFRISNQLVWVVDAFPVSASRVFAPSRHEVRGHLKSRGRNAQGQTTSCKEKERRDFILLGKSNVWRAFVDRQIR